MREPNIYEKFSPDQTILEVPLIEKDGGKNEKVAINSETGAVNSDASAVNIYLDYGIDEKLLTYIKENKVVSSKDVATFLQCGQQWARKILKRLIEQNKITYTGTYRNRRYQLIKEEIDK